MNQEISRLANYFVVQITQAKNSHQDRYNQAYHQIEKLLEEGWTTQEIGECLYDYAQKNPEKVLSIYHINQIMVHYKKKRNLMDPERNYYHNELKEDMQQVVKIKRNRDGTFSKIKTPFSGVTYKKSYTVTDLVFYFYNKMKVEEFFRQERFLNKDEGKANYLLEMYDVEELLYAIDAARSERESANLPLYKDLFMIEKYIEEGRLLLKNKRNLYQQLKIREKVSESEES